MLKIISLLSDNQEFLLYEMICRSMQNRQGRKLFRIHLFLRYKSTTSVFSKGVKGYLNLKMKDYLKLR